MPQVQKPEVRARIQAAALALFADHGFRGTAMADVAARAGVAVANLYRYYANKEALFAAVVPDELAARHRVLLDRTVRSLTYLARGTPPPAANAHSEALLQLWLAHRHAVIILLDRGADTAFADYGARFVARLVQLTVAELRRPVAPTTRAVLSVIFDNTRRALAALLRSSSDEAALRTSITLFRRYQTAGLAAVLAELTPLAARGATRARRR
jgi:AcrR family transcriptional regulator